MFLAILFNSYVSVASLEASLTSSEEGAKPTTGTLLRAKWNSFTLKVGNRLKGTRIFRRFFSKSKATPTEEREKEGKEDKEEGIKEEEAKNVASTSQKRLLAGYHDDTENEALSQMYGEEDKHIVHSDEFKVIISDSELNSGSKEDTPCLVNLKRKIFDLDKKCSAMEGNLQAILFKYDQVLSGLQRNFAPVLKPHEDQRVSKNFEWKNVKKAFRNSSVFVQPSKNISKRTTKKSMYTEKDLRGFPEKIKSTILLVSKSTGEKTNQSPRETISDWLLTDVVRKSLDSKLNRTSTESYSNENVTNYPHLLFSGREILKSSNKVEELLRSKTLKNEFAEDYLKLDESCSGLLQWISARRNVGRRSASSGFSPYLSVFREQKTSYDQEKIEERKIKSGEVTSREKHIEREGEPVTLRFVNEIKRTTVLETFLRKLSNHKKKPRLAKYDRNSSPLTLNRPHSAEKLKGRITSKDGRLSSANNGLTMCPSTEHTLSLRTHGHLKRKGIDNSLGNNKELGTITKCLGRKSIKRLRKCHCRHLFNVKSIKLEGLSKDKPANGQCVPKNENGSVLIVQEINPADERSDGYVSPIITGENSSMNFENGFAVRLSPQGKQPQAIRGMPRRRVPRRFAINGNKRFVGALSEFSRDGLFKKQTSKMDNSAVTSATEKWESFARDNTKRNLDLGVRISKRRIRFADERLGRRSDCTFKTTRRKSNMRKSGNPADQKAEKSNVESSNDSVLTMTFVDSELFKVSEDICAKSLNSTEISSLLRDEGVYNPPTATDKVLTDTRHKQDLNKVESISQFIEEFEKKLDSFRNTLDILSEDPDEECMPNQHKTI